MHLWAKLGKTKGSVLGTAKGVRDNETIENNRSRSTSYELGVLRLIQKVRAGQINLAFMFFQ